MGEIVAFAKPVTSDAKPRRSRKPEPLGYMPVPRRVMLPLKKFERSIDAFASHNGKGFDWAAWYQLLAILEMADEYQ